VREPAGSPVHESYACCEPARRSWIRGRVLRANKRGRHKMYDRVVNSLISWEQICTWHGRTLIMVEPSIPLPARSRRPTSTSTYPLDAHATGLGRRSLPSTGRTYPLHLEEHHRAMGQMLSWTGLADAQVRPDKGKSRRLSAEAFTLIEGLVFHPSSLN